jgi:hypothetical protein
MKKSAQRIQDFQQIPINNEIPELIWLSIRDAPAETFYQNMPMLGESLSIPLMAF